MFYCWLGNYCFTFVVAGCTADMKDTTVAPKCKNGSVTQTTPINGQFVIPELTHDITYLLVWRWWWLCPGLPEWTGTEETFSHSHQSWSSAIFYQLPPSTTIHSILPVQVMCLTVFLHNLCPSPLRSTSLSVTLHFILHTFFHPIVVFFSQHMPIPSQPVLL